MISRAEFVTTARQALGTPWVHQGRNVPHGLDCVGLLLWTLRKLDINHYEPPPYQQDAKWLQFVGYFREHLKEVPLTDWKPGDVLIFRQGVFPCHCGILTDAGVRPCFIHSYIKRRRVVEEELTAAWRHEVVAVFRIPGVA